MPAMRPLNLAEILRASSLASQAPTGIASAVATSRGPRQHLQASVDHASARQLLHPRPIHGKILLRLDPCRLVPGNIGPQSRLFIP